MADSDVLSTIAKTVGYIRKNGPSFEQRLRNSNNPKFSFLNEDDPNHQQYLNQLNSTVETQQNGSDDIEVSETVEQARRLLFQAEIPAVSEFDFDILKLAALFVARNGPEYTARLLAHKKKQQQGAQFGFLNRSHSLHATFQTYVYQYRLTMAALQPQILHLVWPKDDQFTADLQLVEQLLAPDYSVISDAYRRAYHRKQHRIKSRNDRVVQQERQTRFASIDWQQFSLVGKLQFDAVDDVSELPPPLTRDEIIYRSLNTRENDVISTRKRPAEDEATENEAPQPLPIPGMKIRAAGETRLRKQQKTEPTIKCPITGTMIPELQFDNHIKTLLRDPRYQEQQDNYIKKNFKYTSNITTDQVYENIKRLAKRQ